MSISKQEIVALQIEMIKRFSANTMRRGWNTQQAGRVTRVTYRDNRAEAVVLDSNASHDVLLALDKIDNSSCTCTTKRYCHHMAALFFYLYAQHEKRTELFLMQHQQMRLIRSKERENRKKRQTAKSTKDATLNKDQDSRSLTEKDPLASWQHDIDKKFSGYFTTPPHQVEAFLTDVEKYVLRRSEQWESLNRELYHALSHLFILVIAEKRYRAFMDGYKPKQLTESFGRLFELCTDNFGQRIAQVNLTAIDKRGSTRLREISDWLHQVVFRSAADSPVRWLDIYRAYCWKLEELSSVYIEQEKQRLREEMDDDTITVDKRQQLQLGSLHLEFIEEGLPAFHRLLSIVASRGEIEHCFSYVEHSIQTREWEQAKEILTSMLHIVSHHRSRRIKSRYMDDWKKIEQHIDCSDQWRTVLRSLLPYSMEEYSRELERNGEYRLWIDLQMTAGQGPADMNRSTLAEIEHTDVRLLIPLYHQTIDRYISEKRRESYKLAVQLLRHLDTYYDRLRDGERFRTYLSQLTEKYKMLRAFLEELKRSKLIT